MRLHRRRLPALFFHSPRYITESATIFKRTMSIGSVPARCPFTPPTGKEPNSIHQWIHCCHTGMFHRLRYSTVQYVLQLCTFLVLKRPCPVNPHRPGTASFFPTHSLSFNIHPFVTQLSSASYLIVPTASPSIRPIMMKLGQSPITGLMIIKGRYARPPHHYTKIDVDLNEGAGGEFLYLCYTTDVNEEGPITAVTVIEGSGVSAPQGYVKMNEDLNDNAGGKYLYLAYTRNTSFPPIMDMDVLEGDSVNTWPTDSSWYRVNTDLNESAGGKFLYLTYKYDMES